MRVRMGVSSNTVQLLAWHGMAWSAAAAHSPDNPVETPREQLHAIPAERQRGRPAVAVGFREPAHALPRRQPPHLHLAVLGGGCEQLAVPRDGERYDGLQKQQQRTHGSHTKACKLHYERCSHVNKSHTRETMAEVSVKYENSQRHRQSQVGIHLVVQHELVLRLVL